MAKVINKTITTHLTNMKDRDVPQQRKLLGYFLFNIINN